MTRVAIDAAQQTVQIRIAGRILADDRVLDRHADAVAHQAADRVEAAFEVLAERVLRLYIKDERKAGSIGNFAKAHLHPERVARVAAGKRHDAAERVTPHQAGLVERAAERRTDARDRPPVGREAREPVDQRFVLSKGDVVEERVPAVQHPRHAATRDVGRDTLGGVEVQLAPGRGGARQRRNGKYPAQVVLCNRGSCARHGPIQREVVAELAAKA